MQSRGALDHRAGLDKLRPDVPYSRPRFELHELHSCLACCFVGAIVTTLRFAIMICGLGSEREPYAMLPQVSVM